ncbi:hypothetical protein GCM10022267_73160 [Lentzea roselyniae]|uniref:Uncharacterized protein n=1 Tax=Lentzea roselyniae TaxID=531940 RepID=A0ABP7C431_9PSEU
MRQRERRTCSRCPFRAAGRDADHCASAEHENHKTNDPDANLGDNAILPNPPGPSRDRIDAGSPPRH